MNSCTFNVLYQWSTIEVIGIRDFSHLEFEIRDLKAKSGRDSGFKVCMNVRRDIKNDHRDNPIARKFGSERRD